MATEQSLTVDQGSLFRLVIDVLGVDLTGYSARGQVRPNRIATEVWADWSGAQFTVNPVDKQVVLQVTGDLTSVYDWDRGRYDIEIYKSGDPTSPIRILQGDINLDREVTR